MLAKSHFLSGSIKTFARISVFGVLSADHYTMEPVPKCKGEKQFQVDITFTEHNSTSVWSCSVANAEVKSSGCTNWEQGFTQHVEEVRL